jgi:hypothetical protein
MISARPPVAHAMQTRQGLRAHIPDGNVVAITAALKCMKDMRVDLRLMQNHAAYVPSVHPAKTCTIALAQIK